MLKLQRLISDGMVLQRNSDVRIWGFAQPEELVTVNFIGHKYETKADLDGSWEIFLHNLEAGGPYCMEVKASGTIVVKDILIGEVWVGSGQSNMELPMERVKDLYPDEMINCENSYIRQFNVEQRYDFNQAHDDLEAGVWEAASTKTISKFSAVGYFFSKALYERFRVPIGFILCAIGGSPIEAWSSREALKDFPEALSIAQMYKDQDYIKQTIEKDERLTNEWYSNLDKNDLGLQDNSLPWYSSQFDSSKWPSMNLPANFENEGLKNFNGVIWFRKEIDISEEMLKKRARLWLGRIVDSDKTYVNGRFVGEITYQYPPRKYDISHDLLLKGKNVIAVRVVCNNGQGEFISDKPYKLTVENHTIDLSGEWKYKVGAVCSPYTEQTFIQWKPTGLYNGMLVPITKYTIKGVAWYQGESNTTEPKYFELLSGMIKDWRARWKQEKLPFLVVQLPNYGPALNQPCESEWAELREQQKIILSIPETGLVVTIDVGEWNDIHPQRKKDIGLRLALSAQKVAYNEDIVYSGPIYKGMEQKGNKIIIEFENIGTGLEARGGSHLMHFAIAGADRVFVWANAVIERDKVVVWNENVQEPKAVRYAWADNPEGANLINKQGLPASPFSTEE